MIKRVWASFVGEEKEHTWLLCCKIIIIELDKKTFHGKDLSFFLGIQQPDNLLGHDLERIS